MKIRDLGMLNMLESQYIKIMAEDEECIWSGKLCNLMDAPLDLANRDIKTTKTTIEISGTKPTMSFICFTVFDDPIPRKHKLIKTYSVNMRGRRCMCCHSMTVDYIIGHTGRFLCKNCKISKYGEDMEVEL